MNHFNSRPSARGDLAAAGGSGVLCYFNSRPSARGDFVAFRQRLPCKFQFTPLREGRRDAQAPPRKEGIFQFTPLREGRLVGSSKLAMVGLFQFTPLREGRRRARRVQRLPFHFNSRPSARGDVRWARRSIRWTLYFNSRPSARGDSTINRQTPEVE